MIKKTYWYFDNNDLTKSDVIPNDVKYIEQIVSTIGIPSMRAISLKDDKGITFYNGAFTIPTFSRENIIVEHLVG